MTNEEFLEDCERCLPPIYLEHAKKLVAVTEALKNERTAHTDCYCDCNSGSCPCLPCSARMYITDLALENLERE